MWAARKTSPLGWRLLVRLCRCPAVIMMDVFVVRDPSSSLVSNARPLIASSVPSYNSGSTLWFVLIIWTYCRGGIVQLPYWSAVITALRRMTLRVFVFLDFVYWLALTFAKAPGPFGSRGECQWRALRWCVPCWFGCRYCSSRTE